MTSTNPNSDIDDSGVDRWLLPLEKLGTDEFALVAHWSVDRDNVEEYFYPSTVPTALTSGLAELRCVWLVRIGHQDDPCYARSCVIWDPSAQVGRLFTKSIDDLAPGPLFHQLDAESLFPLVLAEMLFIHSPVRVIGGTHLVADSAPCSQIDLTKEDASAVWDPEGFEVYERELVPREKVEEVVRIVYEQCPNGWFKDAYQDPESWLEAAYSKIS